jgi:hypothetical protein
VAARDAERFTEAPQLPRFAALLDNAAKDRSAICHAGKTASYDHD